MMKLLHFLISVGIISGLLGFIACTVSLDEFYTSDTLTENPNYSNAGGTSQTSQKPDDTVESNPPSFITSPTIEALTEETATITWETDSESTTQIEYSTTEGFTPGEGTLIPSVPEGTTTTHRIELIGLSPGMYYYFRAKSTNGNGLGMSKEHSFFTPTTGMGVLPEFSTAITADIVSDTQAILSWETSEATTAQIEYSTDPNLYPGYGTLFPSQVGTSFTTTHEVTLTQLAPGITYYGYVYIHDPSGNIQQSERFQFTMTGELENIYPVMVDGPHIQSISETSVELYFSCNLESAGQVEYSTEKGFAPGEGTLFPSTPGYPDDFTQTLELTGLDASTTYYYHTMCTDANENQYYSTNEYSTQTSVADRYEGWVGRYHIAGWMKDDTSASGSGDGEFYNPIDIAFSTDGAYFYVTDYYNDRIQRWAIDGSTPEWVGKTHTSGWAAGGSSSGGSGEGEFNDPRCIAVDQAGNLYVTEQANDTIQKLDSNGQFLGWIGCGIEADAWQTGARSGCSGSGDAEFRDPRDMYIDDDEDYLYVADYYNNRITRWTLSTGRYQGQLCFGAANWSSGTSCASTSSSYGFNGPTDLVIRNGSLYVVDTYNHRVMKWNVETAAPEGWIGKGHYNGFEISETTSGSGSGDGEFNSPRHIAMDAEGNFVISEYSNHRIQQFNSDGIAVGWIGKTSENTHHTDFVLGDESDNGSGNHEFWNPMGLAIHQDYVYIVDYYEDRVQKWSY